MSTKKTPHTETELIDIFKQDNINEKYFLKFLSYYKVCFDELFEDNEDWDDEDFEDEESLQASALWLTKKYIKSYLELIAAGHGEEWAHAMADSAEDGERKVYFVHFNLMRVNPELAEKELLIHCKSLNNDEFFERHYLYLFKVMSEPNDRIQTAQKYSKIYKEQIEKGKNAVYSHHYAGLMSCGDFNEVYCEEYAFAYDKAISEDKNSEYADIYAERYASALVDIKMRYGVSDEEEMIDFAIEKVNAYMHAWEYGTEHQFKDFNRFAEIYENYHLNTYFADTGKPKGSAIEIDKEVLKKTLEKFNKQ